MKIIIDTDVCKKEGHDIDVLFYLYSIIAGSKITIDTFDKARKKGFLKFNQLYDRRFPFPETVSISDIGKYEADIAQTASKVSVIPNTSEERLTNLAKKLQSIFPAGKKPGYAYTWRDSTSCIVAKLKKFISVYGNYADDKIVEATKRYVDSFNGNYTYMQLLKYFIWKNKVISGQTAEGVTVSEIEKQSQLAAYLENDEEEKHVNHDFDVRLC